MSEMIDRVARAMIAAIDDDEVYVGDDGRGAVADIRSVTVDGHVNFDTLVRAAIAAMREPTGEMKDAGAKTLMSDAFTPKMSGQPSNAWCAMIDAALAD